MIAVIFEVWPAEGRREEYLALAAGLRGELETMDGFISIERFASLGEEGKLLSLSFWRDEAAVTRWRNLEAHRRAQAAGRGGIFRDYRLRIATVLRDYGMSVAGRRRRATARRFTPRGRERLALELRRAGRGRSRRPLTRA